jgi:hypothetical protein
MKLLISLLLAVTSAAAAIDLCPDYRKIHERDVVPHIKSGVPFKLLSVGVDERHTYRRIVRIDYDLWKEIVGVEVIGGERSLVELPSAAGYICKALSFDGERRSGVVKYQIMLNPDLSDGLVRLKSRGSGRSGFLGINWRRLSQDLNSEKLLMEGEINP